MRARKHSTVPFVVAIFHKRGVWLGTLHRFMRAKKLSNVYFLLQICTKGRFDSTSVHEGKNLSSVPFVTTIVHKKQTWLPSLHQFIKIEFPPSIWLRTFHQFMGRRNCTSVPFVITSFHIKVFWLGTLHQFMRAKKHSSVPFVITVVLKRDTWLCILKEFMRAKNHSVVQFVITKVQVEAV